MEAYFKQFLYKTLILVPFFVLSTSYTTVFTESLWVTFLISSDGNIHTCHRSNYLEFKEMINYTDDQIDIKLDYHYKFYDYVIWELVDKKEGYTEVDDLWKAHPNYTETLDKYCYDR